MGAAKTRRKQKDDSIRLRCTTAQKNTLEKAAATAGLSLSSWLLALGLKEAQKTGGDA